MPRSKPNGQTSPRARQAASKSAGKSTQRKGKPVSDKTVSVTFGLSKKERVADDESARPALTATMPAIERVAAVHLDFRSRHWPAHRKAEAAGVSLADWRSIMADPLMIPTMEEAWRQLLLGGVAPALHGMIESSVLVGREGSTDRQVLFKMAGLIKPTFPPGRGAEQPSGMLQGSAVGSRLEAARAGRSLPAPGVEPGLAAEPEAIDADYVEEPSAEESGDTSEFV